MITAAAGKVAKSPEKQFGLRIEGPSVRPPADPRNMAGREGERQACTKAVIFGSGGNREAADSDFFEEFGVRYPLFHIFQSL